MAKYYCILFDADNTLLNFDAAESKALAETLVNYGIEPDAETVQTYRTINEELWRQLEKGQIRREKLLNERFSRFLKAIDAAGDGAEMNRYYLEQLSTHPDLMNAEVLDVLRELSEVATLAVVSNGVHKVQTRRLACPTSWRMCSSPRSWAARSPVHASLTPPCGHWAWRTASMC